MKKEYILIVLTLTICILGFLYLFKYPDFFINSYDECKKAGYQIQESYPEKCITKNGKVFINPINTYDSQIEIKLYFSASTQDPETTKSVTRTSNRKDIAQFSMEELFKGPTLEDVENYEVFSSIILEGDSVCENDFRLSIEEGTATLKICKNIKGGGLMPDARIKESITQTLSQFENIKKVVILDKNDNCLADLSGKNKCLE